jgi:hypothetical protein
MRPPHRPTNSALPWLRPKGTRKNQIPQLVVWNVKGDINQTIVRGGAEVIENGYQRRIGRRRLLGQIFAHQHRRLQDLREHDRILRRVSGNLEAHHNVG